MKAAQRVLRLITAPGKPDLIFSGRPREELEFLPAALEIVETPPPPLPRMAALAIAGLLLCAIAWAALSQVDVVASAPGRFIPAGGSKIVQPLEAGTVAAILVKEGQSVKAGQVLVELEPTETMASRDELSAQLAAAQLDVARLQAVALNQPFVAPPGADVQAVQVARRQAQAQRTELSSKLASLDQQADQKRAELASSEAEAVRLRQMAPLADQQVDVYQSLEKKGYGSKLQLIQAQEKQQDTLRSLDVQEHRRPELKAAIASIVSARAQAAADAAKTDLADLRAAQLKAASLTQDFAKADDHFRGRTLKAPVDGTVQELTIHTIGGVVEPGQVLMRIAPSTSLIEVEARLSNQDVGFVRAGMPAQIKVQTFPFTRYGLIHAKVVSVSSDAVTEERPQARATEPGQGAVEDLHYVIQLAPDRDVIDVDGRLVRLRPGMAVTAEVLTGKRRVISYILSPLAKATREAGRER